MNLEKAKKIMNINFIGPDELNKISDKINIKDYFINKHKIPRIPYNEDILKSSAEDFILILGIPYTKDGKKMTIINMRNFFGFNPLKKEPCFYNQDWYLNEFFSNKESLKFKWYLIKKNIIKETRGIEPDKIKYKLNKSENFPSAVLSVYTFFVYYFHSKGKILWENDFLWCRDKDINGDRIYVGRYKDPEKINKNGFNIHRHLSIRQCYGAIKQII